MERKNIKTRNSKKPVKLKSINTTDTESRLMRMKKKDYAN
jgi:hypothetical protein